MASESPPGLEDMSLDHLRDYILDMVQDLAAIAGQRGDAVTAQALQVCWAKIRASEEHH